MNVTIFFCPRCDEEVASGATWCPHCGRDMTVHPPLESSRQVERANESGGLLQVLDALVLGVGIAIALALIDGGLFSISPRLGLGLWVACLLIVLFGASELLFPTGPSVRGRSGAHTVVQVSGVILRSHRGCWIPPAPLRTILVAAPVLVSLVAIIALEKPVTF